MTVYLIFCKVNNKYYVGQTVQDNLRDYFSHKLSHAMNHHTKKNHIYSALRKYPRASFSIEPLVWCDDKQTLNELEKIWIIALDARNDAIGMNIVAGGKGGWFGRKHKPESRARMILAQRNRKPWTPEQRARHSLIKRGVNNGNYGKRHRWTEEAKQRRSLIQIGRLHSDETKAKMRASAILREATWKKENKYGRR